MPQTYEHGSIINFNLQMRKAGLTEVEKFTWIHIVGNWQTSMNVPFIHLQSLLLTILIHSCAFNYPINYLWIYKKSHCMVRECLPILAQTWPTKWLKGSQLEQEMSKSSIVLDFRVGRGGRDHFPTLLTKLRPR